MKSSDESLKIKTKLPKGSQDKKKGAVLMKISKYTIAKRNTNAISEGEYYVCKATEENRKALARCLMPFGRRADTYIFPYFNK